MAQAQAVELGKLLGAQGVVPGAVTEYPPAKTANVPPAKVSLTTRLINTRTGEVEWTANPTVGGAKRWLTWIVRPWGMGATVISPSAEDQVQRAGKGVFKTLSKRMAELGN